MRRASYSGKTKEEVLTKAVKRLNKESNIDFTKVKNLEKHVRVIEYGDYTATPVVGKS